MAYSKRAPSPFGVVALIGVCVAAMDGCTAGGRTTDGEAAALREWSYDSTMIFPADRSLARPEDGVMLRDGRLLVADERSGLRLVNPDGSSAPFGDMPAAGYLHRPPDHPGGANGVTLEPDGAHVLVTDVLGGGIYRVELSNGRTEKVYQHRYGVNAAARDATGAIWFTQSAQNAPEDGEGRLYAALDIASPEGALLRLPRTAGGFAREAEIVLDSLLFPNGLALDESRGALYVAETTGGRVLRYAADYSTGRLSGRTVLLDSVIGDNLELDAQGRLWIVSPLANELLVVDPSTGMRHTAFQVRTPEQREHAEEFMRRGGAGATRLELLTPAMWAPLPWAITGVILDGDRPAYITGLGDALLELAP